MHGSRERETSDGGLGGGGGDGGARSEGKRTRTEGLVQRKATTVADAGHGDIAARIGVDPGSVRLHDGDGVADGMGARAVATGDDVHLARGELQAPDAGFLVGHELAHVVQQRQGATGAQAKRAGAGPDPLEAEADWAGRAAARGEDVAGQITGVAARGQVQRFESDEHREIGDDATAGPRGEKKTVELAPDYRLTYGEMVAMAGDYFGSIGEMRSLAASPGKGAGTREELEYVRIVKVHGQDKRENDFSEAARKAADKRYYKLAASNPSHFVNPEKGDSARPTSDKVKLGDYDAFTGRFKKVPDSALGHYRLNHLIAIREAMEAGKGGKGIDGPMAANAFADHYLTDSFSAGHNRTPRTSATAYWNAKVPMFFYNFKGFLAEKLAYYINDHNWRGNFASVDYIWGEAKGALDKTLELKGMPDFTFGDLVSGALHDYDNTKGIAVTVGGADKKIFGDGHLHQGDTKDVAVQAVQASAHDIEVAFEVGKAGGDYSALYARIAAGGMFHAEELVPVVKPDAGLPASEQSVKWDHGSAFELLSDAKFREGLKIFLAEKKSELAGVGETLDADYKREAFKKSVVDHMAGDEGITMIWRIIEWTPNTGGGVGGHNQDDNALDYYKRAKQTPGGLRSLLWSARANLIRNLVDGATGGDEEDACFDLLTSGTDTEAKQAIHAVGWDRLEDELGDRFSKRYPKAEFGK